MKEIGGYFGLETLISNEYYKDLIPLNSGRNALLYILKARNVKKLYIPYYICDSITNMLKTYNYEFEYYNIDSMFMPIFTKHIGDNEYLYIVNYYGQLSNDKLMSLSQYYERIIVDNTQAFFQKPIKNIDTIYTCRKFFGVPDGAYLSTTVILQEDISVDISRDRMIHILGRYEGEGADYYKYFQKAENCFEDQPLKYMSKLTHNILGAIDYNRVLSARNDNYCYLNNELGEYNKLKLNAPQGAFSYPIYMEQGISIRKHLVNKKIYIPILWPNILSEVPKESIEYDYVSNILSLPCDQRYGVDDMRYIIEEMKKFV